jgi:hypothetical protein
MLPTFYQRTAHFEVQKRATSTRITGHRNRRLLFVWCLEAKLQVIDLSDGEEPKNEILTIFQGIPSDELKKSFDHWIERCQWVAAKAGNHYPS